jgi:hypothetical protein
MLDLCLHIRKNVYTGDQAPPNKGDIMFDDLPLFRNADPITSVLGAEDVKPRRRTQAELLLAEYLNRPMTDEEAGMASGLALKPKCCYWKRCSELRAGGFIAPTGETRLSTAGSAMQVCEITFKGKIALEGLR